MIDETLEHIEQKIREAPAATDETREELLSLLASLRAELSGLGERDRARAADVVGAHGGTGADEGDVERTVKEFEATHPRLMSALQAFFRTLSDAGV